MSNNTIAAIITPPGTGAVGIVRLSGPDALAIAQRLFDPASSNLKLTAMQGYRGALGRVFDDDGPFDQAVAFVYRAPKSYTGEDIVELCCHGGSYPTHRLLAACIKSGAHPAAPGEFTKRAFLNGKLDLSQAEAVMDLVGAQGRAAARAALTALDGALGEKISELIRGLTAQAAHIAAWCDYPEDDLDPVDTTELARTLSTGVTQLEKLLAGYDTGCLIRDGINIAIVGRPNVGKSTLMNLLCGHSRSIVTHLPGTTRDLVRENVNIAGVVLNLVDTAGIRESDDLAEREGVSRSLSALAAADIVLAVFDASHPLEEDDHQLLERLRSCDPTPVIPLLNKADLPPHLRAGELPFAQPIPISAATGQGREELEAAILATLRLDNIDPTAPLVANERQRLCLTSAAGCLGEAVSALSAGVTLDAVCVCLESALEQLLALTGQRVSAAVIDEVFSRFCVGK